jgi:hypothetical protein
MFGVELNPGLSLQKESSTSSTRRSKHFYQQNEFKLMEKNYEDSTFGAYICVVLNTSENRSEIPGKV